MPSATESRGGATVQDFESDLLAETEAVCIDRGLDRSIAGCVRIHRDLKTLTGPERDRRVGEIRAEVGRLKERADTLGGLYVLGTERQELRRMGDKLRGLAGQHGEPGRSKFFLSFDDALLQRFR